MEEIRQELLAIASENREGKLEAKAVIAFAKSHKDSAIYRWLQAKGCFDAKKAQHAFALMMAQTLIRRVKVIVQQPADSTPVRVRAFVSLQADRSNGGGYRETETVLNNADLRANLIATVLKELNYLRMKYGHLKSLKDVWDTIERINGNAADSAAAGFADVTLAPSK